MLSRHAGAVYWLARFMERVENTARLTDVTYRTMLETGELTGGERLGWGTLLDMTYQRPQYLSLPGRRLDHEEQVLEFTCFDSDNPNSVISCLEQARQNALSIRDVISSEMVEELNKAYRWVQEAKADGLMQESPHEFFQGLKTRCHLFEGVTANTMLRDEGWNFHQAGRWLERGLQTSRLLEVQYRQLTSDSTGTWTRDQHWWISVLRSVAAYEAYRRHYLASVQPRQVVELLVLNPEFPRSVAAASRYLVQATLTIGQLTGGEGRSEANRLSRRLAALISTSLVDEVLIAGPDRFLADCQDQFRRIHDAIGITYFQ